MGADRGAFNTARRWLRDLFCTNRNGIAVPHGNCGAWPSGLSAFVNRGFLHELVAYIKAKDPAWYSAELDGRDVEVVRYDLDSDDFNAAPFLLKEGPETRAPTATPTQEVACAQLDASERSWLSVGQAADAMRCHGCFVPCPVLFYGILAVIVLTCAFCSWYWCFRHKSLNEENHRISELEHDNRMLQSVIALEQQAIGMGPERRHRHHHHHRHRSKRHRRETHVTAMQETGAAGGGGGGGGNRMGRRASIDAMGARAASARAANKKGKHKKPKRKRRATTLQGSGM